MLSSLVLSQDGFSCYAFNSQSAGLLLLACVCVRMRVRTPVKSYARVRCFVSACGNISAMLCAAMLQHHASQEIHDMIVGSSRPSCFKGKVNDRHPNAGGGTSLYTNFGTGAETAHTPIAMMGATNRGSVICPAATDCNGDPKYHPNSR